ncbi:glycosyl hydrolase family 65 protein [Sporosalibacterium faouarense]|uniref:glycosyl hydrolase family 65 protein n=1 Tax=Sporosalibacterium faouarense TaxID=516123 RepID=UPI00311CA9E6
MAGTWMSIVHGFGGFRIKKDTISFSPRLPKPWKRYSFNILFRGNLINVVVDDKRISLDLKIGRSLHIYIYDKEYIIDKDNIIVSMKNNI